MGNGNDSILEAYLFETNSLLEQLDSLVLAAEEKDSFSEEDVNTIFRIMHTIKGSSAMMEYSSLMTIAHRAEDLFAIVRDKSMEIVPEALRPALFDLLFQIIDFFRGEIERIENGQPLTQTIDSLLQKVNSFIQQIQNGAAAAPAEVPPAAPEAPAPADSGPAAVPGFPYALQIFFDEGAGMENLRAFMLVSTIPTRRRRSWTPALRSISGIRHSGMLQSMQSRTPALCVPTRPSIRRRPHPPPRNISPPRRKSRAAPASSREAPKAESAPQPHRESLISVNLSKLDQLSAVVGEIVITESMVTSSPELKGLRLDEFTKSARQLRKLTDELQDVSMSLRMVPVSATFQKMHRIVRDMCKKLNKQAKLTLVGEETEIDKTIVDSIGDPIMHIVRNSMDHGIEEDVQDRIRAGKDPVGEITLSARQTGSEVIIEIRDDGQGVNDEAVLRKAVKNGLASPDVEYSHREILNFLMSPGFSTNTEVTEFSGRGVGMDVVKQNVEAVGGTVSLTSELGKGMTTTLKIPLTTAIMDGMEVSVGGSIFTIPIHNIRQSFKIHSDQLVHDAAGGEIFKCMGSFYPVVRMRELYQIEEGCTQVEDGILIWLEAGELSYCLFVDELLGEQQVVVKPLPSYLNSFNIKRSGIAGCTILGDGNISIILDVANLYSPFR